MALRELLAHTGDDEAVGRLGREGGHAFASASLRPHLIAALAERDAEARARPHVIVAADDRAARDLASDLRAWLQPRLVRYYPSRGGGYESHLRPPRTWWGCAWPRSMPCWRRARSAARRPRTAARSWS